VSKFCSYFIVEQFICPNSILAAEDEVQAISKALTEKPANETTNP